MTTAQEEVRRRLREVLDENWPVESVIMDATSDTAGYTAEDLADVLLDALRLGQPWLIDETM